LNEVHELKQRIPSTPGLRTNRWQERRYPPDMKILAGHLRLNLADLEQLLVDEAHHELWCHQQHD
jgi:hypothetical protein